MTEIVWRQSESLDRPLAVDKTLSPSGVYVRKLIQQVEAKDMEGDTYTKFTYLEAFMTHEQYNNYELMVSIGEQVLGKDNTDEYLAYENQLNTPVLYEANGHYYKPKWATEIYESLVSRGANFPELFPFLIWDATGLPENAVYMNIEDLRALTIFLGALQEQYFNAYKMSKVN